MVALTMSSCRVTCFLFTFLFHCSSIHHVFRDIVHVSVNYFYMKQQEQLVPIIIKLKQVDKKRSKNTYNGYPASIRYEQQKIL